MDVNQEVKTGRGGAVQKRKEALIDLISKGSYSSQGAILDAFKGKGMDKELGVSQSTLSRDLKDLGIEKSVQGFYEVGSELESERRNVTLAKLLLKSNARVQHPVEFFCVACDEGYERLLASQLEETLKDMAVGTITDRGLVLILHKSDEEKTGEKIIEQISKIINKANQG